MPEHRLFVGVFFLLIQSIEVSAFLPSQIHAPVHKFQKQRSHHVQKCIVTKKSTFDCRYSSNLLARESPGEEEALSTGEEANQYAWIFALVLPLLLVYISNQWSRSSIYYLVDFSGNGAAFQAMNVDIGFSQGQYGVLASLSFTALYAIASLFAGIISDRVNRKVLTIGACVIWSCATFGTAFSDSYSQVVAFRILMGLGCAFAAPAAYTLIQQLVPKDRVSLASSMYGTGVAFGGALASLSILLNTNIGWRNTLVAISGYGIAAAVANLFILPNDPKFIEQETDTVESKTVVEEDSQSTVDAIFSDVTEVVSTSRVKWLFLGSFFRFCSGLCIGVWSAPYFSQIFADQRSEYAVSQALITAFGGSISGLIGGAVSDQIANDKTIEEGNLDNIGRKLLVPILGCVLAVPTWYLAVESSQSFETAMAWLAAEYLVAECWFGPTISTLQQTVGPKIGGTAQGMFTLTGAAANLAPTLLGFAYGQTQLTGMEQSTELAHLLELGVGFGYIASAVCFTLSAFSKPPSTSVASIELGR